jgi:hypothetical protein
MAGNTGHPFFGNQYVSSSVAYPGGYTYDWLPNSNITEVFTRSAKVATDSISNIPSNVATPQRAIKVIPKIKSIKIGTGGKIAIITIITAIGTGGYFLYKHIKKKHKLKEGALHAIKLENVGTCKHCGESLSGSEYVAETDSESQTAYIIFHKCGGQNCAWYSDDENDQTVGNN